ncbi:hypothetical protein [Streptomyces boetiae]|uniref:hypothetical protein n=1 Tax=Streptomyces boetiae TaxID=3075541 RepID=UPI00374E1F63
MRNPGGYCCETDGNYSYTIDTRAATSFLTILDEKWALLDAPHGAFTAVPYLPRSLTPVAPAALPGRDLPHRPLDDE